MTDHASGGGTYELTVAGGLGEVLRGVFTTSRIAALETTTVRLEESGDRDLIDIIAIFDAAGVQIQGIYRLRPQHGDEEAVPPHSQRTMSR